MGTDLVDTSLLPSYLFYRLAQYGGVVDAQSCDTGGDRLWHDVGAIISTANTHFEDCRVNLRSLSVKESIAQGDVAYLQAKERMERNQSHESEIHGLRRRASVFPLQSRALVSSPNAISISSPYR